MRKLSEEFNEIVGTIFIGGKWQDHDLKPKIAELEAENERLREGIVNIIMPMHGDELRTTGRKLRGLLMSDD